MPRKRILLLGLWRDKADFLKQLEAVEDEHNVYQVDDQQVNIVKTVEQVHPQHICSRTLDGYDAVIQLFNDKDSRAPDLQVLIPDDLPSYIKLLGLDEETPAEYVRKVLSEIANNKPYRHQEPSVTSPSIFDSLYSWFGGSRKQEAGCPVEHEPRATNYLISSK